MERAYNEVLYVVIPSLMACYVYRIDASGVVDFVSTLLPLLHTELIAGLNKFIPVGYCVKDSHERSKL